MPLVALAILLALPPLSHAQADPGFTPTQSLEALVLRIAEGNGFEHLRDERGLTRTTEFAQVTNGEIPDDFPPSLQDLYGETGVEGVYVSVTNLVPDDWDIARGGPATTIETRVLQLPDANSAQRYVELAFDQQVNQAAELNDGASEFASLVELPDHDGAIAGWTYMTPFLDLATDESATLVPSVRYIAQVGSTIASARISTDDEDLAAGVAPLLLQEQIACITADVACEAIPLPRESATDLEQPGEIDVEATSDAAETVATAIVAVNRANVRSEPSGSASVVVVVPLGEELAVTGDPVEADGFSWLPVTTSEGLTGWIASQLVEVQ